MSIPLADAHTTIAQLPNFTEITIHTEHGDTLTGVVRDPVGHINPGFGGRRVTVGGWEWNFDSEIVQRMGIVAIDITTNTTDPALSPTTTADPFLTGPPPPHTSHTNGHTR